MSLIKQLRRLFLNSTLAILLTTAIAFGFGTANSLAATTSLAQLNNYPSLQLASMNRVEAMQKNVEGKTQEAIGNVTGNAKDQMMGKAKQVESKVWNATEDLKDDMTSNNRAKAIEKNLEGKAQEQIGNITGNRKDQFQGQVKQVESNVRNLVEDMKNTVKDAFN
ncbi:MULTISPECIES: CsbD family protein [Spirulina sp. CCY15215]|uniref:CsbD family protein n=1 Tax=Spirulina sp. CCY15215 TaxID=2767591 RepID=UPI00194E399E|nr:CsbD family protein [Spirulina major]